MGRLRNKDALEAYESLSIGEAPTREQLDSMASYSGWGSFGQELFHGTWEVPIYKDGWKHENDWLREHLSEAEWKSAQNSIISAYYTDPYTVGIVWDMVRRAGFKGGRVLEPALGVGNFYGIMPRDLMNNSNLSGIELDEMTGQIAKALYPEANISIKGYQDSQTADAFYDLVIGNVPFSSTKIIDKRYLKQNPSLHDFFFLKALDQTKPGGLLAFITSSLTLDKKASVIRRTLAEGADMVASFRLPSGAFKEYAGTSVVTDLIILKRRESPRPVDDMSDVDWINSDDFQVDGGRINLNRYYINNPSHILGRIGYGSGTTFGREGMIVERRGNFLETFQEAINRIPEGVATSHLQKEKFTHLTNHTSDRHNSITEQDGALVVVKGEYVVPLDEIFKYRVKSEKTTKERESQIRDLIKVSKAYSALMQAEIYSDPKAESLRKNLKSEYDTFVNSHGKVGDSYALSVVMKRSGDPRYYDLKALEGGENKAPAAIFTKSVMRKKPLLGNASISDAYIISRNKSVKPDMAEIARISNKTEQEVIDDLINKGAIFELPEGGYEVSEIYQGGNVRRKLREAQDAISYNPSLSRNIEALEKVIPDTVPYYNIEIRMGAIWAGTDIYKSFFADLAGINPESSDYSFVKVVLTNGVLSLETNKKLNALALGAQFDSKRSVGRSFTSVMSAALQNRTVVIKYKDSDGVTHADDEKTKLINSYITEVRELFSNWSWSEASRRINLENAYNESMNAIAEAKYDGGFLQFEGMALTLGSDSFNLRKHQADAIWRGIANQRGLYAHEVGTGKSFTIAGLAVESRKYGIANKPLILAHNANSSALAKDIQTMYPGAKVLYINNFDSKTIQDKLYQIKNDDWDAIVLPHSQIDKMALSRETLHELAADDIAAMEAAAIEAASEDGHSLTLADLDDPEKIKKTRSYTAKQLVKQRNALIANIEKMGLRASEKGVSFEELGIDMIIVDEAHVFKKPPFVSTTMKLKGLNSGASGRSASLALLTSYIKRQNSGKGVHLFTGTPITNTLNEIFNMQRYIMDSEMERDGIKQWDNWFATFADSVTDIELTSTGEYDTVTRLASFINVPELRSMLSNYVDVVFSKDMPEFKPRKTNSGKTITGNLSDSEHDEILNGRTENAKDKPYKKIVNITSQLGENQRNMLDSFVSAP